jgi:site-specific DNA recombinase
VVKMIKVAFGYVRTSSDLNPKFSIENQIRLIQEYAKENEIYLKHIFVDEKKTGTKIEGRDEYKRLIRLIKEKAIDMVIVTFSDRLGRETLEFVRVLNLMKNHGIEYVSISEGLKGSRMNPLHVVMTGLSVELDNKHRTARISASKANSRSKGEFVQQPPFGYVRDKNRKLQIHKNDGKSVKKIFNLFIDGLKLGEIVKRLCDDGLKTKSGTDWKSSDILRVLTNKTYTGKHYKKKNSKRNEKGYFEYELLNSHDHPAIIPLDLFELAQEILAKHYRKSNKVKKHFHLLTKILECPQCHKNMRADALNYKCPSGECPFKTAKKKDIDAAFLKFLCMDEKVDDSLKEDQKIIEVIDGLIDKKKKISIKFAVGKITENTFQNEMAKINTLIKQNQEKRDIVVYLDEGTSYKQLIDQNLIEELKKQLLIEKQKYTFNKKGKEIIIKKV